MARGDVLIMELPSSELREQSGRRPAVAVQMDVLDEPMLVVAPITSNLAALRFAFSVRVEPSPENGLAVPSVVMIFQIRAVDKQRIVRKIGQMGSADMTRIDAEIWRCGDGSNEPYSGYRIAATRSAEASLGLRSLP